MYYHNVNAQDWTPPNTNEVVVTGDGNMGVGVVQPTAKLQVAGTFKLDSLANPNGEKYGQTKSILVNNIYHPKGIYQVDFDSDKLPNGIYFYTIKTPTYSETKKMLLIK